MEEKIMKLNIVDGVLICEKCDAPMKYDVEQRTWRTLVGFFSPEGHDHDDNCVSRVYKCPNEHSLTVSKRNHCPKCNWIGKKSCFCHKRLKVEEWPN